MTRARQEMEKAQTEALNAATAAWDSEDEAEGGEAEKDEAKNAHPQKDGVKEKPTEVVKEVAKRSGTAAKPRKAAKEAEELVVRRDS